MDEESTSSDIVICGKRKVDTWDIRICKKFFAGGCEDGENCKLKHTVYIIDVVCKFLLLHGECYKGPQCPFIHEIVSEKVPECKNQTGNSSCDRPLCKFRHSSKKEVKECIFYNSGFCQMGKFCKFKHNSRELCRNILVQGECKTEECDSVHLEDTNSRKFSVFEDFIAQAYYRLHKDAKNIEYNDIYQLCFRCMCFGHHPSKCENPEKSRVVRCYKCMKYGHKSNSCPGTLQEFK